ncbi:MAG: hypothetical protein RL417_2516 [Pseudomonadota bacterium]
MSRSHMGMIARGAAALCLAVNLLACDQKGGPDNPDTRRLAALRYHQALPMEQMMDELTSQLAMQAPPEAREEVKKMMFDGLDFKRLRDVSVELMVKHFTAGEINSLTDFYSSPEGRSVMQKMPTYTAELMPNIQQEVMRNMPTPGQ